MSQRRILDYGSPVIAQTIKDLSHSISPAGRLSGFTFSVDAANRMKISPGSAMTGEGVIVIEDEFKFIQVNNTTPPADYTVVYLHQDQDISGGVTASLTLNSGLLTASVVQGVILGYVRYPGGAIPLNNSHFLQSPVLQIGSRIPTPNSANWVVPVRNMGYMQTAASGGALTFTDTYDSLGMYLKIRNNTATTGSVTLTFPFKVSDYKYSKLQITLAADVNATVSPIFLDTSSISTSLLTSPLSSISILTLNQIDLPHLSNQVPNNLVYLQLMITCQANRQVLLQSIGLTEYTLPV